MTEIKTFEQYQKESYTRLNEHPTAELRTLNWAIGIGEESGEILGIIKHVIFGGEPMDIVNKMKLAKEVGDILWYLSALCSHYNISLEACAKLNVAKLEHRYEFGTQYSKEMSQQRHVKEIAFAETEVYKQLTEQVICG